MYLYVERTLGYIHYSFHFTVICRGLFRVRTIRPLESGTGKTVRKRLFDWTQPLCDVGTIPP